MTNSMAKNLPEINRVSSILLSTLDESIFFNELGKFLHIQLQLDQTIIRSVQHGLDTQIVSENGKVVEGAAILEKGRGPAGHVVRTKKAYFSNSIDRDPLFEAEAIEGISSELCIPVVIEGIVIATIHLRSIHEKREFSREDISFVESILDELKKPLTNMKMYLAAKHLNESLLKKIENKEKELKEKEKGITLGANFKIVEKDIIGNSAAMKRVLHLADKVGEAKVNALLQGERGVGKEMVARRIHCRSNRADGAFLSVDCSALGERELEIELFGLESGEFNGRKIKHGLIELCHGGTLFINNIGMMPLSIQSKVQMFLKEKLAFRVGGQIPYRADVRIFAATIVDLAERVKEGTFREDLFFTLNTMSLTVPSMRERKEDIEQLSNYFMNHDKGPALHKSLSPCVVKILLDYSWPGNVRELQNVMERAYILSDGMIVEKEHLADSVTSGEVIEEVEDQNAYLFTEMTLDDLEKKHICMTLEHLSGNKTKTAKLLGITVKTLYNKLHSYGMIAPKEQ